MNIIGGCCGTTEKYIKTVSSEVEGLKPEKRESSQSLRLASRTETVATGKNKPLRTIGERINPTSKKKMIDELKDLKYQRVKTEVRRQKKADLLDVNVMAEGVDESKALPGAVSEIQNLTNQPLVLDSTDPEALEKALKVYCGKALINSVSLEKSKLDSIVPLAKKYGAALVGLTMDDDGIPQDPDGRVELARKLIKELTGRRIHKRNICIDPIIMTVGSKADGPGITLEALRQISGKLDTATVLGISNVSHGLPARELLNTSFLTMAAGSGLDAAIIDVTGTEIQKTLKSTSALLEGEKALREFTEKYKDRKTKKPEDSEETDESDKSPIYRSVLEGDKENISGLIEEQLRSDIPPMKIIDNDLMPALREVGNRFENGKLFLPQIVLSNA